MWLEAISNFNAFRSRKCEGDIQDIEEERKFKSGMGMRKKRKRGGS